MWHGQARERYHCPACPWSKHVSIGEEAGYPPCGGMMRGVDVGDEQVVWRCLGCGFMMRGLSGRLDELIHLPMAGCRRASWPPPGDDLVSRVVALVA
jgi:hypothetical protein